MQVTCVVLGKRVTELQVRTQVQRQEGGMLQGPAGEGRQGQRRPGGALRRGRKEGWKEGVILAVWTKSSLDRGGKKKKTHIAAHRRF